MRGSIQACRLSLTRWHEPVPGILGAIGESLRGFPPPPCHQLCSHAGLRCFSCSRLFIQRVSVLRLFIFLRMFYSISSRSCLSFNRHLGLLAVLLSFEFFLNLASRSLLLRVASASGRFFLKTTTGTNDGEEYTAGTYLGIKLLLLLKYWYAI
jgi:hypothetical protein